MRIIAGEFRGRNLLAPATDQTRPITDRVKQSVFDVLMPYLADAVVFDVFAGTGSLGLESISRGCKSAIFFESDPSALALLGKNILALKVESRAKIVRGDLFAWFAAERTGVLQADLLFLDPPYRFLNDRASELKTLAENITSKYLSPTGQIIFRHDLRDSLELPNLHPFDVRDYGSMRVDFLVQTASQRSPGAGVP
jgi:16S rRNA (guanine966-N2)-methyltransferase